MPRQGLKNMEENLRESGEKESVYRHLGSEAFNLSNAQSFYRPNDKLLVVSKADDRIRAVGDNFYVDEHGVRVGIEVEVQHEGSRMPMKPNLQGRSVLVVQGPGEFGNMQPYYADLSGILGGGGMGSGDSLDGMLPMVERGGYDLEAGSSYFQASRDSARGMQNIRSLDEDENRSNEGSASHGARMAEFQHHRDQPMGKVKLMCSFGGKILPRPSDGKLRYVGGETRIITVNKGITYADLVQKLTDAYGQALVLKYQLPDEDLDALVSVSSDEDLENMMEEYSRLEGGEGSSRLRVFLFSTADYDLSHFDAMNDKWSAKQRYVDAVNGITGIPEMGFGKNADSIKVTSLQQVEKMNAYEAPEKWCGTPRAQESTTQSFFSVQVTQDTTNSAHLPLNVPLSLKQPISSAPVTLLPSLPPLSSLPIGAKQSAVASIPMFFPEQPLKVSGHPYSTRPSESEQDMKYGGTAVTTSACHHDLYYRFSELRIPEVSTKTDPVLSPPSGQPVLLRGSDERVDDTVLPRVDSHGIPVLDHRLDVQSVMDPQTIVFQHPPPPLYQAQRKHHPDAHQDSYKRMDYTHQAGFEGGNLQQSPQQHSTFSAHLFSQQLANNEATSLRQSDQARLQEDMINGASLHKVVSTQRTGLHMVGSDPLPPHVVSRQTTGPLQQQYGIAVYNYTDQGGRVFYPIPSTSPASYHELTSEKFIPPQIFSIEQQYGRQQAMSHEHVSHQHALSHAYSDTSLLDRRAKAVQPVYERTLHSDGSARPVPSYTGPSTTQDEVIFKDYQGMNGQKSGSGQHGNETELNLSGVQGYTVTSNPSESVVQQPFVLPNFREKLDRNDGLLQQRILEHNDAARQFVLSPKMPETRVKAEQIPQSLESSHARLGESYTALGFAEDVNAVFEPGMDCSYGTYQKTEAFKPLEGTYTKIPAISGQPGVVGLFTEPLQALEPTRQTKEIGVPPSVDSIQDHRGTHLITEHSINQQVPSSNSETWLGDCLDAVLAKDEDALRQLGNLSETEPKNVVPLIASDKAHQSVDNLNMGGFSENPSHLSHGSQGHQPGLVKSLLEDNKEHSVYVQPKVMSNSSSDGGKISSGPDLTTLPISIIDSNMVNILSPDLATSETLQTSWIVEPTVFISSSDNNIPILSDGNSVSFSLQFEGEGAISTHEKIKKGMSDEHVKAELQSVAENVAEVALRPPLLPAPTLSMNEWAQVNDDVKHEEHTSNGRVTEAVEEDILINEEDAKVKDSDNDESTSAAVNVEAEASSHGLQIIKNADLEELQELGSGTFGTVYHGKWRGSDVAIKRIKNSCFAGRPSQQERLRADFWSEACLLSKLHHPNIVAFYGVVPDGPGGTLGTVTEYMVNGSLKHVLQRKDRTIDHRKRVIIATDAAFGMEYLHNKRIVHFDLKCENLLVNMRDPQRPICKVGDFGLSKIKHQTLVSGGVRGTLPWMAPELLNGSSSKVSEKVDVFSFGIVMWELLTGDEPYADMYYGAIIGGIVNNTLRPPVPNWCDPSWRSLMEQCWSADPTARLSFTEIVNELRAMAASLHSKGQGHHASVQAHAQKQS